MQAAILTAVEQTGQALFARQPLKEPYVLRLIGTIQTIQLFVRLAYEENLLPERHFFAISDRIQELNKMSVGWLSSVRPPRPGPAVSPQTGGVNTNIH